MGGPKKRKPEGEDINWLVSEIGYPLPTWVEKELYAREFADDNRQVTASLLINMLSNLGTKINKALAIEAGDFESINFKYWRKLSDKATKMKPTRLRATLYEHPDYDKVWLHVEEI